MAVDIAVAFQDIDDLYRVVEISKEDDVALEQKAANIRSQFGPGTSQCPRQSSQAPALIAQPPDEAAASFDAAALLGDEGQDVDKIAPCRGQIFQAAHSETRLGEFLCLGFQHCIEAGVIDLAAFGDRPVQGFAQGL